MKQGLIIYHEKEAVKNKGFISLLQQAGKRHGISFSYCPYSDYQRYSGEPVQLVLNRTRAPEVSRWFQERGALVRHEAGFVEVANHKYRMLQYFQKMLPREVLRGKWCPKSIFLSRQEAVCIEQSMDESMDQSEDRKTKAENDLSGKVFEGLGADPEQIVIKSVDGHGGNEVFLLSDDKHWKSLLQGKELLLQERLQSDAQDLRIYILGGRIYQAILRQGRKDFRSNYSLGGQVCAYEPSKDQVSFVMSFVHSLPESWQGMYGIDFILTKSGAMIFNEIEEMVGCRMLYACTDKNIAEDYVKWLSNELVI